jgi:nucleotide-binding universal stress UspA family protein
VTRIRRILHATDFSRSSRPALRHAIDLARANRAELLIVHVQGPLVPYVGEGYALPQAYGDMLAELRTQGKRQLDRLVRRARAAGIRATGLLLEGVPDAQIVRAAKAKRADVIVIGTHGHTGLARLLLGSVAARVVARAPCPVLTVRARSR